MGTLNIIDWCKENGSPKLTLEMRAESVVTTFLPSSFFATGKRPEEQAEEAKKVRPESLEKEVIRLLRKESLSKSEISQILGHKHISEGLKKVLSSLLKQGKIIYTLSEKPNSRLQKYKLTDKTKD
ncbi:hypothetical protein NEOC84_001418|uniref:Fic family protein n=1 Tax=Neochlamydia sp. AcF84 TaxID=2315858 RepID=UPI0014081D0A|nr:hypothetical protein [Neochlamydia sp. AcF84]NGY95497.1 hypothetical protein [Neochlamydia sp. AcF84]